MRARKSFATNQKSEFELDLAPLLAVMVKLVPVLLVSSAFVQMSIIETELPQVVKEAIERQEQNPDQTPQVSLNVSETGFVLEVKQKGETKSSSIPLGADKNYDWATLKSNLVSFKQQHPDIFKLEINPSESLKYEQIVKVMDEVRKSPQAGMKWKFIDPNTKKEVATEYFFPEITFGNTSEGT